MASVRSVGAIFDRPFAFADIEAAVAKAQALMSAEDLTQISARDLRFGMTLVERVNGKRVYFGVQHVPVHKGHQVYVTVSVNGHRLNWVFDMNAPVQIKEN